jgi:hypothetical protein
MGVKMKGFEGLNIRLQRIGDETPKLVREQMREAGQDVERLARAFAPVDEGNLEQAIQALEERGDANRIEVVVGVVDNGTRNIKTYAEQMHEGLAPHGSGAFQLGPLSQAKRARGKFVGGKFLTRAWTVVSKSGPDQIGKAIRRALS